MVIEEMTQAECRALLGRADIARLACARNNQPYVVPIHVDAEDEFLYCYATLGQKIEWMRQNPLVCIELEELITHAHWTSVVVLGRYEELPNTIEYQGERRVAERLFQRHPTWWEPASVPLADREQRPRITFRIRIVRMTGRRAGPAPNEASDGKRPSWLAQVLRRLRSVQSGRPKSSALMA